MVNEPMSSNATVHQAAGYPQGGGYGGPPQGGGFDQGGAGGGGFGPAGGGGFPPGGGGMTPGGEEVNTTKPFILAALSFFCGCGLLAAIPGYFAYQAHQAKGQGDMATAKEKAALATKIGGAMVGIMAVIWVLYIVFMVVMAVIGS
jgi:hypothetical protein